MQIDRRSLRRVSHLLAVMLMILSPAGPTRAQDTLSPEGLAAIGTCETTGGTGTVSGYVIASNGVPAEDAVVRLYTAQGYSLRYTNTNLNGAFSMVGVKGGVYNLQVSPPQTSADQMEWYDNQIDLVNANDLIVAEGATTSVVVDLNPGAALSGQVRDDAGQPVPDGEVSVYNAAGERVATARSGLSGDYQTSPGLPPGTYRLEVDPGYQPLGSGFYKYPSGSASATPIVITTPNAVSGLDVILMRTARLTGQVTHVDTGQPVSARVLVEGPNGGDVQTTDVQGRYTSNAPLGAGTYRVTFLQTSSDQNLTGTAHTVTLGSSGTTTVNGTLSPGGLISGRVTDANGAALSGARVVAADVLGRTTASTFSDATGAYSVTGLSSGTYTVSFSRFGHLETFYDRKPNSTSANPVPVTAAAVTAGINAALALGASITGTVTAADTGLPLAGVSVRLYADGPNVPRATTRTDALGHYAFAGLQGGVYRVQFRPIAFDSACGYQAAWFNGAAPGGAVSVTAPNVTPHISAALVRGSALGGQVVHAASGRPIEEALVRVYSLQGELVAEGQTGVFGGYLTAPALPGGSYRVFFSDGTAGAIDEYYNDQPTAATADWVTVVAPDDLTGVSAALAPGGMISGRVTAADSGLCLRDVVVTAYAEDGAVVGATLTDADGQFVITDGLPTGVYRVGFLPGIASNQLELHSAAPPSSPPLLERPAASPSACADPTGYRPQYFTGQATLAQATTVAVTAPLTTMNIDVALSRGIFLPEITR